MKLRSFIKQNFEGIKSILFLFLFIILLFMLFSKLTYLFRNTNDDRLNMIGIQNENNLDVIYVGGSSTFVYWEPLKAWNDCGFTSYNYATNSQELVAPKYYIKEALKTQNPKLFVVEMRSFLYCEESVHEAGLRNGADGMTWYSANRWRYIYNYLKNHNADDNIDVFSYYFDIAKYHTNLSNLSNPVAWKYSDNSEGCDSKGFRWVDAWNCLEPPVDYLTDDRGDVPQKCIDILTDLLDYCDEQNLQVLFVLSPKYVGAAEMKQYNTLGDIIESRGYKFLNTNKYYDEMSFDFSTDVYNEHHVNCYGAEKYTQFLEEYIVSNYDLPDNRGNESYSSWDENYNKFAEEEIYYKSLIDARQENYKLSLEYEKEMSSETEFYKWAALISDSRYYIFSTQTEIDLSSLDIGKYKVLQNLGLTDDLNGYVVYNNSIISKTTDNNYQYSGSITRNYSNTISYVVNNENLQNSITIDNVEYSRCGNGINIVVLDTILGRVVDSVTLTVFDGEIKIER